MKTLADLKRALTLGTKVNVMNKINGLDELRPILWTKTNGVVTGRAVTGGQAKICKEQGIKTYQNGGWYYLPYHLNYPKAKHMRISGNTAEWLAYKEDGVMYPSPDFTEGETWLTMEVL